MIDATDITCPRLIRELRAVVMRLALVSHAATASYETLAPPDQKNPERWRTRDVRPPVPHLKSRHNVHAGSSIPIRGGIDFIADITPEFRLKSHLYFQRRLERMVRAKKNHGSADLRRLLKEAEDALDAWQRTPIPMGQEPEYGSPQWKFYVAQSSEDAGRLAARFNVSRRYINKVRRQYSSKAYIEETDVA